MDFAKIIGNYIRHLRKQTTYNQRVHAFSIAGVITVILATLWLHFHYGFWSFGSEEVYSTDQSYEIRDLSAPASTTQEKENPQSVFTNFFEEIRQRINSVPTNFSSVISDTKTFQRPE